MAGSNGIKEYLKKKALVNIIHLDSLKGKRIAIDVSGVIHRAKIHSGEKWLLQFINLMHKFSNSNITPIIVFDGKPPVEKSETIEERKKKIEKNKTKINNIMDSFGYVNDNSDLNSYKYIDSLDSLDSLDSIDSLDIIDSDDSIDTNIFNNYFNDNLMKINKLLKQTNSIKNKDIELCKQFCIYMGIAFIHIKSLEADYIFPELIIQGIADGVYSEDNDMFLLGCKKVYFGLNYNLNTIHEFIYDECLYTMNVTSDQFNNAFIAAGTWNNDNIEYCKFNETINLMIEYNTIENVIANLEKINFGKTSRIIKVPKQFDFIKTREIFSRKLSSKIQKQISNYINNFLSIIENVKINYKKYSQILFDYIDTICDINKKEFLKYKKQVKEYYKNVYDICLI